MVSWTGPGTLHVDETSFGVLGRPVGRWAWLRGLVWLLGLDAGSVIQSRFKMHARHCTLWAGLGAVVAGPELGAWTMCTVQYEAVSRGHWRQGRGPCRIGTTTIWRLWGLEK